MKNNLYIFYPRELFFTIRISGILIQVPSIRINAINATIAWHLFDILSYDMPDLSFGDLPSAKVRRIEDFPNQPLFPGQTSEVSGVPLAPNPPPNKEIQLIIHHINLYNLI